MKTIKLVGIDEVIYYEKLDNGLDVYLYSKEGINNNYVTFTTKFGSIYSAFIPINESNMKVVPKGVAHFLEHKVFEQKKEPQPEDFFSESGALCNAYTTFKNTSYLFSGPNNLKENVLFLLDFVQSPYFTDDNVESEKGIITQEIHMCDDNPSDVMYDNIRKNAFYKNPFKDSIIGTVKDIQSIDKKVLYTCYETFYNPENMFLVVTGNFDVNDLINSIKENQNNKKFKKLDKLKIKKYNEPDKVVKKMDIINMNTPIPKVSYNIKISLEHTSISKRKYNLYLYIIFTILFNDTSIFDEECKKENIITNTIYLNLLNCDSHMLVSLINETNDYEKLLNKIKETLNNIEISEEDLERNKKVLLSNELFSFENIELINEMIIDNILFENKIEDNIIEIIKSLNKEELDDIINNLNLENNSTIIIKNK